MIPADWKPHHRDEDGEVLGYLRPTDQEGSYIPVGPFGYPLAGAADEDTARAALDTAGLAYLAERWLLSVPGRAEPVSVRIVEVTPERMRVANEDFGYEEADYGQIFVLEVPQTERLRPA